MNLFLYKYIVSISPLVLLYILIIHNENLFFLTPFLQIPYAQNHFYNSVVFILRKLSSINLIGIGYCHMSIKLGTCFTPNVKKRYPFL
ncbi:hypothetical protein DN401_19315 [Bacillus sp. BF2-3]|nr:hypothetical protein DN401_19315 [Bacillus sp. BF2-3]QCC40629.1 hypothetical protein C3Y97_12455 [Bacillus sp. DU-106]RKN52358.1 hypothetical protein D7H67_28310 [Bacillus sp. S66]